MAGGIGGRIRSLEVAHGGGPCEECGDGGGGPETWEVVWMDPVEPAEPEWCGTCGRPLEIVVSWDGIPDRRGPLPPDAA